MRRTWLPSVLCLAVAASLFSGVTAGALWDPHELSVAEPARRIALNLLGGSQLAIPGADNSVPIRAELGRGELPFTSAALGFRLFGLSEWAGRLPLVLWSVLGLLALYGALARLWDRRTALYGVVILATTPLYFLQARNLLGDAVTLATFTMAWSGLATAILAPDVSVRVRALFGVVGVLGLYGGFWCRGPIVSVAVPALAIGLAARFAPPPSALLRLWAVALLALGALALALGVLGLSLAEQTGEYSVFVGSALHPQPTASTFDGSLSDLAHAAFPWSALAPLLLALPWRAEPDARRGITAAALLALSFSLAASAWLAPTLGSFVLPAIACFAVLLALALREIEARPRPLAVAGVVCAALAVLLGMDLHTYPEKVLSGFGLPGVELPESLQQASGTLWKWSGLVLAGGCALCLLERDAEEARPSFHRAEYARVLAQLQQLWNGNLVFAVLVLEAALVGFLLLSAVSERIVHLEQLDSFGVLSRELVALGAVAVPCAALVPLAAMAVRDLGRLVFARRARWGLATPTRAQGVLCVAAAVSLAGSFGFYPEVSRQLAPKQVFERYRQLGRPGEPLGMLGDASVTARYQAGARAHQLASPAAASSWLEAGGRAAPRRWLLVRKSSLPELNASYRERHARNLPILDARSSELLLASDRLLPGERDESPLAGLVLDAAPLPQHALRAVFAGKLELIGWSLQDSAGRPVSSMAPGASYRFLIYLRVLAPLAGNWQTFLHIDGLQRRFNADHPPLDGKYPISAWRPGDFLVDSTELLLEPNFSPGQYRVYFGFFAGTRRLEVTEGPASDDRIAAGSLRID